jgi:hypothetical protein
LIYHCANRRDCCIRKLGHILSNRRQFFLLEKGVNEHAIVDFDKELLCRFVALKFGRLKPQPTKNLPIVPQMKNRTGNRLRDLLAESEWDDERRPVQQFLKIASYSGC